MYMQNIKRVSLDLVAFLKTPFIPIKKKIKASSLIFLFGIAFLIILPFAFIDKIPFLVRFFNIKEDIFLADFKENKTLFFCMVVILGPVLEECIFRLFLNRLAYIRALMCFTIGFLFYLLSGYSNPIFWMVFIILAFLVTASVVDLPYVKAGIKQIRQRHFKEVFYLSAIMFGISHITNYSIFGYKALLAVVLVIPQVIMGVLFGYLRLRYGLVIAIVAHVINNLLSFLMYLVIY